MFVYIIDHIYFTNNGEIKKVFTDLDFADDVSITAKMLEVLILALEIMNEESSVLVLKSTGTRILFCINFVLFL